MALARRSLREALHAGDDVVDRETLVRHLLPQAAAAEARAAEVVVARVMAAPPASDVGPHFLHAAQRRAPL